MEDLNHSSILHTQNRSCFVLLFFCLLILFEFLFTSMAQILWWSSGCVLGQVQELLALIPVAQEDTRRWAWWNWDPETDRNLFPATGLLFCANSVVILANTWSKKALKLSLNFNFKMSYFIFLLEHIKTLVFSQLFKFLRKNCLTKIKQNTNQHVFIFGLPR